ncbi:EAL domain-containing protein [Vibrio chagasii]|nr:EAL domain-containing protein [Vibrio chagasii]CAH6811978.1 EAL domain-containing protein [Vibrio chagasii]CAH6844397.1 EAL domain-containing protein [Vibrio chagasii]CAH6982615.1 EAL domain-containing protein [Vibrio chagasii]CAH7025904.1 EAL domain-containing protein [Vibrio chagasii]
MNISSCSLQAKVLVEEVNQGLFYPVFQPILNGNGVVGAEVLLRWQKNFNVEESIRCLSELDKIAWFTQRFLQVVAAEVLSKAKMINFLTINISPIHVSSLTFIRDISPILQACNKLGVTLWIELTERDRYPVGIDHKRMLSQLGVCRGLGIKIALDDYGTGYNVGENLLNTVRPNILKIDRSLMKNKSENLLLWARFKHVAQKYNIGLLSEGIESAEDFSFAKSQGITYFQGYHLGKPGSLNQLLNQTKLKFAR